MKQKFTVTVILLVGFITVILFVLRRHRARIVSGDPDVQYTLGFFLKLYQPQFYYFECIDFIRKMILVGLIGLDEFWRIFDIEKGI